MRKLTYYEVYRVKLGRWALHARHADRELRRAVKVAKELYADTGAATRVLEETQDPETERVIARVVAQNGPAPPGIEGPSTDTGIGPRVFMVGVNAVGIGVIVVMIMALTLSSFRDSGAADSAFNMFLLFTFGATAHTAGLTLFKIYIPQDWLMWRSKAPEARRRAVEALLYGAPETPSRARPPAEPEDIPAAADFTPSDFEDGLEAEAWADTDTNPREAADAADAVSFSARRMETNADQGEQTSFRIADTPPIDPGTSFAPAPDESAAASLAASAAAAMEALLDEQLVRLFAFADAGIAALMATRDQLSSFERVGLNLYLAGAASALAGLAELPEAVKLELLRKTLVHSGTNAVVAEAFAQRLEASLQRPRFRHLVEAGHAAMLAQIGGDAGAALPALADLIQHWADPNVRATEAKKVTFLLTQIGGAAPPLGKQGNGEPQQVMRAHNLAVRAAAKNFRGTEVNQTGTGMLLTFPDPAAAARAAIEIQQEVTAYGRDNADVPLAMRIGLHVGDASIEEGEYFGPALELLSGICAAAGDNEIFCSEDAKSKAVGPVFRFQAMGKRSMMGSLVEFRVFKLDWAPKIKVSRGPMEYRQIGGRKPTA